MIQNSSSKKIPPEPIYTFKGIKSPVHSLNFILSSKEEKLLTGSGNGHIQVWDFETRRQTHSFSVGCEGSACVSILTYGNEELISHTRGDSVVCWVRMSDGTWKENRKLKSPTLDFCGATLVTVASKTAVSYLSDSKGKGLEIACPQTGSTLFFLPTPQEFGGVMSQSSAGPDLLMTLFETGNINIWDLKFSKTPLNAMNKISDKDEGYSAMCLAFDAKLQQGVVGSSAASIETFSMNTDHSLKYHQSTPIANTGLSGVAIRNDSLLVATSGWDSRVRVFEWRPQISKKSALKPLAVLDSYTRDQSLQCIAFSPSPVTSWSIPHLLASGGNDCSVCLWDIYN
ncbi:hypothetical protein B566_EDAN006491 [Ephemera danica]|nr:hypothetical protein B566_EDAN006491 [Ephemera danica]